MNARRNIRALALVSTVAWIASGCMPQGEDQGEVTVYTSQDRIYAEPIFQQFQAKTGIRVRAVFDSEAVKTVGLANRLLAEKSRPRCDVFWSNEAQRTLDLARQAVLTEFLGTHSAVRHRRFVVNTNLVNLHQAPRTLSALTNSEWKGRLALAYPMFGTTGGHLLAARNSMGSGHWSAWLQELANQKPLILDGNSVVVKMVGLGRAAIGLTDSDDVRAGQREGLPIAALSIEDVPMSIRASVGIISGRPESKAVRQLAAYLTGEEVSKALVASGGFDDVRPTREPENEPRWNVASNSHSNQQEKDRELLQRLFTR